MSGPDVLGQAALAEAGPAEAAPAEQRLVGPCSSCRFMSGYCQHPELVQTYASRELTVTHPFDPPEGFGCVLWTARGA